MAPIRRYLRISKYSVLECRIYLDNPALAQPWLLSPRNPVLPRVIESVRPLVLPKLREEKERSRKRSTKKKGIKDVVVEDDFEVSIFLTETNTRHSLVTKHKHFHDTTQTKLTSNSGRLVGASHDAPIDVDLRAAAAPITLLEESESEDAATGLAAIPTAPAAADDADVAAAPRRRPKRVRTNTIGAEPDAHEQGAESDLEMVSSDDAAPGPGSLGRQPPTKRRKAAVDEDTEGEDKKKLALDISYEGFSIYGRVLCLVVKRRERPNASTTGGAWGGNTSRARQDAAAGDGGGGGGGQAMMENFIISTQVPAGAEADAGPVPQGQAN